MPKLHGAARDVHPIQKKEKMHLETLTQRIVSKRSERGFVTDPLKIHVLLSEEVGEIAGELKKLWSKNYAAFESEKLSEEIADVFCLLAALANEFDIDIEEAVEAKFFKADESRAWKTAVQQGNTADGQTAAPDL